MIAYIDVQIILFAKKEIWIGVTAYLLQNG